MKRNKLASPIHIIFSILTLLYIAIALNVAIALTQQLQRPPEKRTWYGKIARLPYDFRIPKVDRIRATYWNKDTSKIILPKVFGIGWSINMYPIIHHKEVLELQ